jgi:N-acetylneuraminate synthase
MSVEVIAEAGVNHNGSVEIAEQLVDVAAAAGADYVKFQTFRTEEVISRRAPKARYQVETTAVDESQFDMVKKLELDGDAHERLLRRCQERGIRFLSTPFDLDSVDLLTKRLGLRTLKIASGEITNAPLLLKAAGAAERIILSTGMSTLGDIELALGVLAFGFLAEGEPPSVNAFRAAYASERGRDALRGRVTLLHCTTQYPSPVADVNLRAMDTMRAEFGLPVGYSDHTTGITISIAAAARGAVVIEKHFTLDRAMEGPDHRASVEPDELRALVQGVREAHEAIGDGMKAPAASEIENIAIARKSLVARRAIRKGEQIEASMLGAKRPGTGVSPLLHWSYLGRTADRDYEPDEEIR